MGSGTRGLEAQGTVYACDAKLDLTSFSEELAANGVEGMQTERREGKDEQGMKKRPKLPLREH